MEVNFFSNLGAVIVCTVECVLYWQLRILLDFVKEAGDTYSGADLDPGTGAFLTPGSGIGDRFFSGSR